MTYQEIEAFLKIVECSSLTRAADSLHITQPALSKRLQLLEEELGYQLIIRQRGIKSITLTERGMAFVPLANLWISSWNDARALIHYEKNELFCVSASDGPHLYIFSDIYKQFIDAYPDVHLRINTTSFPEMVRGVEKGITHLAFTGANYYAQNTLIHPAYSEKMYFVCRTGASYPDLVHPSNILCRNFILSRYSRDYYNWFKYWFGNQGQAFVEVDLIEQVKDLLLSLHEKICTIVPVSVAVDFEKDPRLCVHRLSAPPPDRIIYYIQNIKTSSPYTSVFLNLLKQKLEGMQGISCLY